ncbi:hypothetical protein, partial [Lysobacter sp. CA199]|uniref:hypothetical protein n=1 Tax=Lysobacter sp. CA199 TaxID=3455608 RepID=UPI003F8D6E04
PRAGWDEEPADVAGANRIAGAGTSEGSRLAPPDAVQSQEGPGLVRKNTEEAGSVTFPRRNWHWLPLTTLRSAIAQFSFFCQRSSQDLKDGSTGGAHAVQTMAIRTATKVSGSDFFMAGIRSRDELTNGRQNTAVC